MDGPSLSVLSLLGPLLVLTKARRVKGFLLLNILLKLAEKLDLIYQWFLGQLLAKTYISNALNEGSNLHEDVDIWNFLHS